MANSIDGFGRIQPRAQGLESAAAGCAGSGRVLRTETAQLVGREFFMHMRNGLHGCRWNQQELASCVFPGMQLMNGQVGCRVGWRLKLHFSKISA